MGYCGTTTAERSRHAEELRELRRQAWHDGYRDSIADAGGILSLSERQVRRILEAGYVKSRKVGARVYVHHGSLLSYAGLG